MSKHDIRNKLTEHQGNYKLCNLNLLSCYAGLYPASLTKLSLVIFNQIIFNKMYHSKDSQYYDPQEEKRIYTKSPVNPATLLENCHPIKYRYEERDASKDFGNMSRRISELDDNNIFYTWKCGYPKNYMFILERDIGLWRYYNPNAFVTPKTIRKIIGSTKGMCQSMQKILEESGDNTTIYDIRKSFCMFVHRMVKKMNPNISDSLEQWEDDKDFKKYLTTLNKELKDLNPYAGLEEDENFYKRLPLDIQLKLSPPPRKKNVNKELENDLVPKDEDLIKKKKKTRKRIPSKVAETNFETFKKIDPMENVNSFIRYYRSVVKDQYPNAEFYDFISESNIASLIMDDILESGQDKDFLRSWMSFYAETKLKGNNMRNKEKTSLKSLKETYEEYSSRYIGCGV